MADTTVVPLAAPIGIVPRTLTEDTRAATDWQKPLLAGAAGILAGAQKAATRGADVDWREPALAATRAEAAVMEAATILLSLRNSMFELNDQNGYFRRPVAGRSFRRGVQEDKDGAPGHSRRIDRVQ